MSRRADHRSQSGFSLIELLVVVSLTAVLGVAVTNVVLSTMRAQQYNDGMRTVMDDARISLDRIRKELRPAQRVLAAGSDDSSLRFWVDQNQDGQMQAAELICYGVSEIGDTGRYELLRWSGAFDDCDEPGADATTIARTLVTPDGVFAYEPQPDTDPFAPRTRMVEIRFVLEVEGERGPDSVVVETSVRIRNVR